MFVIYQLLVKSDMSVLGGIRVKVPQVEESTVKDTPAVMGVSCVLSDDSQNASQRENHDQLDDVKHSALHTLAHCA